MLSPASQNAAGIQAWSKFAGEADLVQLVVDLREQVKRVQTGDMGEVEAVLYGHRRRLGLLMPLLGMWWPGLATWLPRLLLGK